jgi:ketosteroid isomerase-like protein
MRHKAISLVIICLLFASLSLAQAKSTESKSTPPKAGVPNKAFIQEILNAWQTLDTAVVGKYYDQSPTNVFYDVAPLKYDGWGQYANGVKEGFASMKSINFSANDDAVVHHAGKLAWGTTTLKTVMTDKAGKVTSFQGRWTIVWEKKGENWVIVHDHFSAPMPM